MTRRELSTASVLVACALAAACAPSTSTMAAASGGEPAAGTPAMAVASPTTTPSTQFVIACEPGQQAQVRYTVAASGQVSEVTCVDRPDRAGAVASGRTASSRLVTVPARASRDDFVSLGDDLPATTAATVRARPAVYTVADGPERRTRQVPARRSVKKSAVIIGTSAGVGAGIGAIVGGKKGALIGAAAGGGGAALWDQITRRR